MSVRPRRAHSKPPLSEVCATLDGMKGISYRRTTVTVAAGTAAALLAACSSSENSDDADRRLGLGPYASSTASTAPGPTATAAAATSTPAGSSTPNPTAPASTPTTPGASSMTSAPVAGGNSKAVQAAKAAYTEMERDSNTASRTRDESLLSRHAAGAALQRLQLGFNTQGDRHYYVTGETTHALQVTTQNNGVVTLLDCAGTAAIRYVDARTNEVTGRGQPGYFTESVTVTRQPDGTWKVSEYLDVKTAKPCTPGA